MSKRSKRTRLSRDEIIKKSTTPTSGGGSWFRLREGVEIWEPKEKGKYLIDVVPYETTSKNHPNGVAAGVVWYQHPFKIHHGIGADGKSVVCPTTIGKKCPICEEIQKLSKDYDTNKETILSIRPQRYVAFNILHPDDPDKIAIFALSVGKFYNKLEQEIQESDEEEIANFFDVTDAGKTLKVRFSEATYAGKKYLEATKIEFVDREPMDEDEIFSKVVNLDEMFVVMDYEKLNSLFLQTEEEVHDEEEEEEPAPKSKAKAKLKKDEEEDEDEEEDDIPFDHPSKKTLPKASTKPTKQDEEEDEDEDDEDEETPKKPLKSKASTKPTKQDEDDDDDEEEDEDEETPKKPLKSKASTKPTKQDEEEDEEEDDDEEDDDDWGDDDDEED